MHYPIDLIVDNDLLQLLYVENVRVQVWANVCKRSPGRLHNVRHDNVFDAVLFAEQKYNTPTISIMHQNNITRTASKWERLRGHALPRKKRQSYGQVMAIRKVKFFS